jgi:NAD(P)-dependent dehydrogenase (short-subunit alcohol dehydrogenase family)
MGRLDNKVAIITGAGQGMGRVAAILFAKEGAKVIVAELLSDAGQETVTMVKKAGGNAIFVKTDVSKTEDVKKMIKAAVDTYGKLDVLYNNAAIVAEWAPITDWTEDNFDRIVEVNAKGVWLGMKYAIPEMAKAGGGAIINIASTAALIAQRNSAIYAMTKGGVIAMSRVAAVEFAPKNIRVNCIAPGPVATELLKKAFSPEVIGRIVSETPLGRLGEPKELAQVALFLASDESSWITGQCVVVDGGIQADSHLDVIQQG